jgi:hypothetical protein
MDRSEIFIRKVEYGPFGKNKKIKEIVTIEELLPIQDEIKKYEKPKLHGLECLPYNPNKIFSYEFEW